MNGGKMIKTLCSMAAGFLFLFAPVAASAAAMVKVDGSSTVFPITEAVAEEFQAAEKGKTRVMVGISGTGGGFKKFCTKEVDVNDASRPIKPSEVELCKKNGVEFIELPIAYDGIAVVVNKKNNWASSMTVDDLKKIWEPKAQGKITRWNQVNPKWPNQELHLFGAGVDSGTYDYFTEAIVGKEHSSRGDFTSSEDDNVLVQGIATDQYALGFMGIAYFENNSDKVKGVPVDDNNPANGKGPIAASYENVSKGTYQPLSRPLFIYVSKQSAGKPEIQRFIKFYLDNAPGLSKEVGYISLPQEAYGLAQKRFDSRKTGSLFGGQGSQVGVKIEELLKKEK